MKILLLLISTFTFARTSVVTKGELTYTVEHAFKTIKSTSKNVKGKLVCKKQECSFLAATTTKSFVSKDGNRDTKTWELLKASVYPIISVRGNAKDLNFKTITVKILDIEKSYDQDSFKINIYKNSARGFLNIKLSDFKIEKPSLLGFAIKDNVRVDFNLKLQKNK